MYTDLLIKIKNAGAAKHEFLKVRYNKADNAVLELLKKKGFIKKFEVKGRMPKRIIEIELDPTRSLGGLKFLSKPSRRLYSGYKKVKRVKSGYGMAVLSTPKGFLSDKEARKEKVGGELLFEIW